VLAALPFALVLAGPAASVQAASPPATPAASGPCLLGILLCGNNVVAQPSPPCVAGAVACNPLPTPCVVGAVLCPGGVVTVPTATPTVTPAGTPPPAGGPGSGPGAAGAGGGGLVPLAGTSVALIGAPGVGLVPRSITTGSGSPATTGVDPNPDAYTELLSLAIRDGLRVGGFQLWPLLAALQVILLVLVVGFFAARRVLRASKLPAE
jgi:hypothetical protein